MSSVFPNLKLICGIILGLMCVDQLTKFGVYYWIPAVPTVFYIYPYGGIGIFRDLWGVEFSLNHLTNKGAAWGIGADHQIILVVIRVALILGLFFYLFRINDSRDLKQKIPLAIIIAGASSNVLDFFIYGHVIDMFHFVLWGYDFPTFNLADSAISVGIALMFLVNFIAPSSPDCLFSKKVV